MSGIKHVVGFSGGIDSQACALWVRQRFPAEEVILLNSQSGRNEHPITTSFVQWYSDTIFPVIEVVPLIKDLGTRGTKEGKTRDRRQEFHDDDELTFERLAYVNGRFPSRKAQFCTEHLKLAPQLRWMKENLEANGIDYERYVGVRRDESPMRREKLAGLGPAPRIWDTYFDCYLNYPIADWTKQQCIEFLQAHGEEINPLYRLGFGRVGCAPCINSGKQDIREWAARFPEMIDKVRQWETYCGRTFFAPCVPGKAINWIDEVVAWARTARGGKQVLLPMLEAEPEVCSSKYGLCE